MREIKFRAWLGNEQGMCEWEILRKLHLATVAGCKYPMQYTGLKDKNGVEIYEGDILSSGTFGLPVKFHKHQGRWFAGSNAAHIFWGHKFRLYEIIGNIHENPELIES